MKTKNSTLSVLLKSIILLTFFIKADKIFAQAPANDLCANAINLTVNGACTSGTNVASTTTAGTDGATGCWLTAASHTVWYQFTTGATANTYVISTDNGGSTDTQIKLFTNACTGTLAPAPNCNDDGGGVNTLASVITTSALATNTTYYIMVDVYSTTTGTFCISVQTLPDICAAATTLTPGAGCTNGTTAGASTSGDGAGVGAANCWTGLNAYSNSVFYNFTATNDSMTVSFANGSLGTDLFAAVYSGACGSLTQLAAPSCIINGNDINMSGLTVGNTYYIMVDGNSTTVGTFCISVSSSLPGNNNLVPLINTSACGLNYAAASARITSRATGLAGTGLPATLNITGIPSTCRVIDKAYLFYETSFTSTAPINAPTVSVVNPAAATFNYTAALVGRSHQKCWGEMGTASYRTDVTSAITGNGNYVINTNYTANEIDGMTLLIVYRNLNATYEGHLIIDNGIITINDFTSAAHTMTGINACAAASGKTFVIAGDFQFATHTNTATGASATVPVDNFWNFDTLATNFTNGQASVAFTSASNYIATADCFSLVATGAYFKTTTCTNCSLALAATITPTQTTCGLNNGAATANASTAAFGPYNYSWSPGGMTTQTVTGLAPGTYTVTVSDASGCKTATQTVTINSSSPVNASVSPQSTTICSGSSTSLTASGGGTYSWNTGPATAAITVSPTSTTNYTVTVTSGACSDTAIAIVNVNPAPVATFSYTGTPYCQNAANPSPTFSGGGTAGTFTSTAGLSINAATGVVNLSSSTPGTYTVTNTIAASGGCPAVTATATITITAPSAATFSYTGSPYCNNAGNASPTFSGSGVAGTFTSGSGLSINSGTGVVNLSSSTPGTYTVTNTIAAAGSCPATSATASITITAAPVATFSYTGSPYCQNASNPSPTFSGGGVAGTFTSTAGLSINASTGLVNLSASTPGTYTVTNTIAASGGCAASSATANITITAAPVATFSYIANPYCKNGTNPSPTFSGGGVAGTFTSTAGLSINAATGTINLSASTAGTYTVTNTIAASGGCPATSATASITISNAPVATFSYSGTPYCQNAANPSPVFSGGGVAGTFSSTAGLSINASTGVVNLSASTPGTYTVTNTIPASGGCAAVTATSGIIVNPTQSAAFSYSSSTFCSTGTNATPTITGTAGGTFSATPAGLVFVSTTTGEIDVASSMLNTYSVTYTTPGPCASSTTINVTVTNAPSATFSYTASPYCQNSADPSPTFSGGGTAGIFSSTAGLSINASTGVIDLSASSPGTYTVTNDIPASGGCSAANATANITIDPSQNAGFSYASAAYCKSAANPTPTITGVAGGAFTSSPAGLVFVNTVTGEINLAASASATYTITYTTAGPCADSSAVSVSITDAALASFSYSGTPYCQDAADPSPTFAGGAIAGSFSSTAGLVFVNTNTGEVDLSASAAGTYTVTNTIPASGGCAAVSDSANITINAPQTATFSYTSSPYCQNAVNPSPSFNGGGVAGTFSSTSGLSFVNVNTGEIDLQASTPGTYTITNTIAATGGCNAITSSSSVTIDQMQSAAFNYSGNTFCATGSNPTPTITGTSGGIFTASPAGLVFVNTGTGEIDIAASSLNTYDITYTTSGPCADTSTVSITITNAPVATFSYTGTPYCQNSGNPFPTFSGGGTAGVFSSTGGLVFVNANSGEVDLSASTAGTYTVTNDIAASGGCAAASASSNITINPVQDPAFSYAASSYCQSGTNPIPTITGTSGGTFTSSPAGLVFANNNTGEIDLAASSLNTYTITYTTAGPCADSSTVSVTISSGTMGTFSYTGTPYCQSAGTASPTFSGGGVAGTFSSTSGLSINSGTGDVNLSTSTAGTYTVTNTIAASGGCPASNATANITITAPQVATFSYTGTPYCQNASNPSPTFSGGGVAGIFSSTSGLNINISSGLVNLAASSAGTYTVTNSIPASGGCPATSATSPITINPLQSAAFSYPSNTFCETASDPTPTITGVSGGTFSATPAGLNINSGSGKITLNSSTANTYTVTYTTPGPCSNSSTATVTITSSPLGAASGNDACEGEAVNLAASGGSTYNWTGPNSFTSSAQNPVISNATPANSGTYTVVVNSGGCTDSAQVTIAVNPAVVASAGADVTISYGTTTTLNATGGGTYSWSPVTNLSCADCASPVASPKETTDYCVTVNNGGCTNTSCVKVSVEILCPENKDLGIPNAFSPNDDGNNDMFCLLGWDRCMSDFNIYVYNRWGEKVFESSYVQFCWDGNYLGKKLNPGVFVYFIKATTASGEKIERKGNISLFR